MKRRRRYDSTGRRQRAAEAQARVLDAARALFAARGYAETTMDAIASAAGVAVPTVYAAFGSKQGLLSRLLGQLVVGETGTPSVMQTSAAQAVLAERDPRRALAAFAAHMAEIQARIATTYQVMQHAARTEPEIAAMFARSQRARLANLTKVAEHLAALRALRRGLTAEEAGRTIWVLASPDVRRLMVEQGSPDDYRAWLERTLTAALLRPSR